MITALRLHLLHLHHTGGRERLKAHHPFGPGLWGPGCLLCWSGQRGWKVGTPATCNTSAGWTESTELTPAAPIKHSVQMAKWDGVIALNGNNLGIRPMVGGSQWLWGGQWGCSSRHSSSQSAGVPGSSPASLSRFSRETRARAPNQPGGQADDDDHSSGSCHATHLLRARKHARHFTRTISNLYNHTNTQLYGWDKQGTEGEGTCTRSHGRHQLRLTPKPAWLQSPSSFLHCITQLLAVDPHVHPEA